MLGREGRGRRTNRTAVPSDGTELVHRSDDNESTIENRLRVFEAHTRPVIKFYGEREKLITVDAEGEIDEITKRIREALKPFAHTHKRSG